MGLHAFKKTLHMTGVYLAAKQYGRERNFVVSKKFMDGFAWFLAKNIKIEAFRDIKAMFGTVLKNYFFVLLFRENKKIVWKLFNYFQKTTFEKCNPKNKKQKIRFSCFQLFYEKYKKIRKHHKNN